MKKTQKMKRMSVSDVKMAFPEIERTEQAFYVGRWKYIYDNAGKYLRYENDGKPTLATICVEGKEGFITMPESDFSEIRFGRGGSVANAENFFCFMDAKTDVEWAFKEEGGKGFAFTDRDPEQVEITVNGQTTRVMHSHKTNLVPSQEDRDFVSDTVVSGKNIKFTLYYKGVRQDYNQYDDDGDPYSILYSPGGNPYY